MDASCLAFLVRRAVEDKKEEEEEEEEEERKKVKGREAQITEEGLRVQERTQELLREATSSYFFSAFAAALQATPVLACVFADFWDDFFCGVTS